MPIAAPVQAALQAAAARHGLDWRALASIASYESGLNAHATGDGGHAFGLFQLNNAGGTITGVANPGQYYDPNRNAEFAASAMQKLGLDKLSPEQQVIQGVRRFERPAAPDPEVAGALKYLRTNFKGGKLPAVAPVAAPGGRTAPQLPRGVQAPGPVDTLSTGRSGLLQQLMANNVMYAGGNPAANPGLGVMAQLTQQASQPVAQAPAAPTTKLAPGVTTDHPGPISPTAPGIIGLAKKYLGTPYKWGGANPKTGFDCSGFVQWLYGQKGVSLPRTTYQQINVGQHINDPANLRPGDIVFFSNHGDVHHEGMYIGNNQFIHAPHTGDVIKVSSLSDPYYQQQFAGGRRVTK